MTKLIKWIKNLLTSNLLIPCIALLVTCAVLFNMVKKKDAEIARQVNNKEYYVDLLNDNKEKGRVLQLTLNELSTSNDSLIQKINQQKKELKIKDKELKAVQLVETEIVKVVTDTITKEVNFTKELKLNDLTTIVVDRKDSLLSVTLDFKNEQTLFLYERKEYRNQYKNWFKRLVKFDFKKDKIRRYQITNTNDLIQVTNTRIIEL